MDIEKRRAMAKHLRLLCDSLENEKCDDIPVDWWSIVKRTIEIAYELSKKID